MTKQDSDRILDETVHYGVLNVVIHYDGPEGGTRAIDAGGKSLREIASNVAVANRAEGTGATNGLGTGIGNNLFKLIKYDRDAGTLHVKMETD